MSDIGMTVGLIKALGSPDPAVIEGAVSDWLDDHPEATTTVEDGAISYAKLDSSLQGSIDDVGDLKTSIEELPSVMDSDADDVDLDITDSDGYVLGRFSDGHFQTKNFDSRDISGADASTVEIDLSTQNVVNFNLEYGNDWRSSSTYRGVLIPKSALKDTVTFDADENKLIFAFLKDNNIANNFSANVCSGTTVGRISAHSVITTIVPDDCEYLYVYISDGSFIGTISVYTTVSATGIATEINNLRGEIEALKNQTGAYYITDAEQILLSLKRRYAGAPRNFTDLIAGDDLMLISHISDLHNDPDSYENYISFFNDNIDLIDCAVVTGDIVDSATTSAYAEMTALDANIPSGAKFLKVVGNHDRGSASLSDVFTSMNMSVSTSGETLYYVTDFADKNIRIIVLNQYDNTSQYANATAHYSQTQIDWFISKLSEAAANGYQVIVCYHSCNEMGFPAYNTKGFCQTVYYEEQQSVTSGTIIGDIINAFQTGGSLSETYTSSDTGDTVTVSATFSTPGVFVCYLCGHEHVDYIGYSKVYPNQLVCMVQGAVITSSTRQDGNWQSHYDTPRVADTSTENSINVYAIDTSSRLVKVAKFGSTVTDKLMPRSLATFGY